MTDMVKPYPHRPLKVGGRRAVETFDLASVLMRIGGGISGVLMVNRSAWGRKGRIALQIFGSRGSILFDQERFNEFQLYLADDSPTDQGFRTVLGSPQHKPYDCFIPAPGHGLGFNDLKIIECRELLTAIDGAPARIVNFDAGYEIERTVHAMARSFAGRQWITLNPSAAVNS